MSDILQTLVRSGFKFFAAWLITRGIKIDDSQGEVIIGGCVALFSVLWGVWHRSGGNPPNPQRTFKFLLLLLCLLPMGCTRFRSVQTESKDGERKTTVTVCSFWDSKSELAKLRASSTEKTQSLNVSGLTESASGTNAANLIENVTRAAVGAAIHAASGGFSP